MRWLCIPPPHRERSSPKPDVECNFLVIDLFYFQKAIGDRVSVAWCWSTSVAHFWASCCQSISVLSTEADLFCVVNCHYLFFISHNLQCPLVFHNFVQQCSIIRFGKTVWVCWIQSWQCLERLWFQQALDCVWVSLFLCFPLPAERPVCFWL